MNTNHIHIVVVLLLLSLTAHEAHSAVYHDVEACEVCIHVQSNDDILPAAEPNYVLLDIAFHIKIRSSAIAFHPYTLFPADFIRGPPQFSFV